MTHGLSRRQTLTGAAALGVATPLLAACGGGGSDNTASEPPASGATLGPSSEVPVGGGKIYADKKVVVTQPSAGDFKGFSAVCTHQGCLVSKVANGTIDCTCHGSKFSATDGSVVNGPATSPLSPVTVTADGSDLVTG